MEGGRTEGGREGGRGKERKNLESTELLLKIKTVLYIYYSAILCYLIYIRQSNTASVCSAQIFRTFASKVKNNYHVQVYMCNYISRA